MNKTAFLALLVSLAVSVPIAAWLLANTPQRFRPQNELVGKKLVTGLKVTDVKEVRIADSESEAILALKDGKWVVANRGDYPLDDVGELERLVTAILRLKVGLEIPATENYFPEMALLSPDEKEKIEKYKEERKAEGEENPADPSGLLITLKGEGGKELSSLVLGSDFGGDPGQPLRGHVLRALNGNKGVWKVVGSVNRRNGDFATGEVRRGPIAQPKSWLEYDFIKMEKIKSISVSAPNDKDFKPWTLTRPIDLGEFTTGDLTADEEMNSSAISGFKNLFSAMRFEDVLTAAEAESRKDPAKARKVVITTFDGFTYTIDYAPAKPEEPKEDDETPPSPSNYLATITVEADLNPVRSKAPDETPEQTAAIDKTFEVQLENLKNKLAREQAFQGRVYEFANFTMNVLDKTRADLVQPKQPATPPQGGPPPGFPGGQPGQPPVNLPFLPPGAEPNVPNGNDRPEAVTPPVRVPSGPPEEAEDNE